MAAVGEQHSLVTGLESLYDEEPTMDRLEGEKDASQEWSHLRQQVVNCYVVMWLNALSAAPSSFFVLGDIPCPCRN